MAFQLVRVPASALRVAGSRYALGPYTPVDPLDDGNESSRARLGDLAKKSVIFLDAIAHV